MGPGAGDLPAGLRVNKAEEFRYGATVRHYRGVRYVFIGFATQTETTEELAIYSLSGYLWARPKEMFLGSVEVEGRTVQRFEVVP